MRRPTATRQTDGDFRFKTPNIKNHWDSRKKDPGSFVPEPPREERPEVTQTHVRDRRDQQLDWSAEGFALLAMRRAVKKEKSLFRGADSSGERPKPVKSVWGSLLVAQPSVRNARGSISMRGTITERDGKAQQKKKFGFSGDHTLWVYGLEIVFLQAWNFWFFFKFGKNTVVNKLNICYFNISYGAQ